jgi:hypothetical protein
MTMMEIILELFKDALQLNSCTASNGKIIVKSQARNDIEGGGHDLFYGTTSALACR